MKKILVTFATAATLLVTPNAFADDATKSEIQAQEVAQEQTKTIAQKLEELKENLKDLAKNGSEKFNQTLSDTYNQMSQAIAEIKDEKGKELQKALDDANGKIKEYKKAGTKQQEQMRQAIIDKLDALNKNINEHNEEKAKS
ncbi:hypothetical protein [Rickettsia endosymbiont of Lasioglossum villosulum]|uniref:hypothetical protein n=1 Tax=Rickettsia endosymbiont of Lasioglossum villosulum TaxID=3066269 RepID=UPI0031331F3C